ncbi:MAG TPA: VanZ family protein, partial [Gammaproteobacteria bacterium]|nr:VanZ family protein [Gammaproteobacteria bacterium]
GARAQAFFLTLGYGLFDEWHQSWVPGRLSSATDLGVDALGALVVLMLTPVLEESLPTRLKS